MHKQLGWPHVLGGRAHQHGTPLTALITNQLDYIGYETHRPDYSAYLEARRLHPTRPILMEDRFRVRRNSRWPDKDYDLELTRRGLWHSAMAGGVGNIWGYLVPDAEPDGMSQPYPNREQCLTYARFFQNRFTADLSPASEISSGWCLASPESGRYLFYQEETESIRMDLSEMSGPQPAVAVDTRKPYEELKLGPIEATRFEWKAPYESDWAIAVGFEQSENMP